jgi:hypothetical protein
MLVRKDNVLVVIASKLNDPRDRAQFLKLSKLTEQWLARQPGFLRYELYETAVGWFDTMLWQDVASADAGNAAFAETDIARNFAKIVHPTFRASTGVFIEL